MISQSSIDIIAEGLSVVNEAGERGEKTGPPSLIASCDRATRRRLAHYGSRIKTPHDLRKFMEELPITADKDTILAAITPGLPFPLTDYEALLFSQVDEEFEHMKELAAQVDNQAHLYAILHQIDDPETRYQVFEQMKPYLKFNALPC